MASASRHFCPCLRLASRITPAKRKCIQPALGQMRSHARPFSSSFSWQVDRPAAHVSQTKQRASKKHPGGDDDDVPDLPEIDPSDYKTPSNPATPADLDPEERANYETLSKDEQVKYLGLPNHYKAIFEDGDDDLDSDDAQRQIAQLEREAEIAHPFNFDMSVIKDRELGYWGEEEDDELGQTPDDDDTWDESMITSVAESQLEVHREVREYTRVAAWEMPLLQKYARPFVPPDNATPLRFRYTTYMGEHHPAQKKVVVEFSTKDLQASVSPHLTEAQRIKLIKLVGVRYNPDRDVVRMSSERFDHAAQNKRYLGDLINTLVKEARSTEDTFEDIPLDFRYHKPKVEHVFPDEWRITPQRVQQLNGTRQAAKALPQPTLKELQRQKEKEGAQRVMEYATAMPLGRREPPSHRAV